MLICWFLAFMNELCAFIYWPAVVSFGTSEETRLSQNRAGMWSLRSRNWYDGIILHWCSLWYLLNWKLMAAYHMQVSLEERTGCRFVVCYSDSNQPKHFGVKPWGLHISQKGFILTLFRRTLLGRVFKQKNQSSS